MTPDEQLASELATEAGRRLVDLRARLADGDPTELRKHGDRSSHEFLAAALAEARPEDVVFSEEGLDDRLRLGAERVWIVDPLDGTREYGEPGRTDWAVHVALWERGDLVAAAVALPARPLTLTTSLAERRNEDVPDRPRLVVSRTRAPAFVTTVASLLDAELVPLGSAGAKTMSLVLGEADVYVHSGGMREWDAAAPSAIAVAAGLHVSRFDGSPLVFNTPEALTTELVICPPRLADRVLSAVSEAASPGG